jgi:hypothetical protein
MKYWINIEEPYDSAGSITFYKGDVTPTRHGIDGKFQSLPYADLEVIIMLPYPAEFDQIMTNWEAMENHELTLERMKEIIALIKEELITQCEDDIRYAKYCLAFLDKEYKG